MLSYVDAHISLEEAIEGSFRGRKIWKFIFFKAYFLEEKRGSATKKKSVFWNNFGMLMSVSKTYFLEVSAHVSLKVAAEGSFRGKKKQK